MNILIIAPFSPPYNGNSLPVKFMVDELEGRHHIEVVNVAKKGAPNGFTLKKVAQTAGILKEIWQHRKGKQLIYLTVAESLVGNVRDFVIYFMFRKRLANVLIHMLGGAGMKKAIEKGWGPRFWLNRYFLSRLGGVIVEGQTQAEFFAKVIDRQKIHVIPNFAEDYLFNDVGSVKKKFASTDPLRILFLSNLLYGKGHNELIAAYKSLPSAVRDHVIIEIAGGFESDSERITFLESIRDLPGVTFHGHVLGDKKRELYHRAHIFCLPTYYPWEGQPFCILEAYAAGCVVITTDHSGIGQVFSDGINGFEVQKQSVASLREAIERIVSASSCLEAVGKQNLEAARCQYTTAIYKDSMLRAIAMTVSMKNKQTPEVEALN